MVRVDIFVLLCVVGALALDVQKQLEQENTLDYILELAGNHSLARFDRRHHRKCVNLDCCVCEQSFKTMKDSAIHSALHHQHLLKYDADIAVLFDEDIPSDERETFCRQYLIHNVNTNNTAQ